MLATLIIVSSSAQLGQLQAALGESRLRHHDLGSLRKNGLVRKQSIWMRDWVVSSEPPESPLSQVLDWYEPLRPSLLSIDSRASVRLLARADTGETFTIPLKLSRQLHELGVYVAVDLSNRPVSLA